MLNDHQQLQRLREVAEPVCRAHGVSLLDARFATEHGLVLRVLIEREGADAEQGSGVSLADCQAVSRDLATALDAQDHVVPAGRYRLEVGSPGLDRPLFSAGDYDRFRGREARLSTRIPREGRRRFTGTLLGVDDDARVMLRVDGRDIAIPLDDIATARLVARL
jgi:ribosome maturation factor RimP